MGRIHTDLALKANWNTRFNFWIGRFSQFGLIPIRHEDLRMLGSSVVVINEHPFSEAMAKPNEESGWESTILAF